jgi:predicted MPP superfamily phosphohydrolase
MITLLGVLALVATLTVIYGTFVEPKLLTVTRATIPIKLHRQLTIVVLSDLHVGPYVQEAEIRRVVEKANQLMPDLVLLAGDYVQQDRGDAETLAALNPLSDLKPSIGTFAVFGNHDHGVSRWLHGLKYMPADPSPLIAEKLRNLGITLLVNQSMKLDLGADTLTIAGVDDAWSKNADLVATLKERDPASPTILLSHNPDVILDPLSGEANLIVSGHSHGGQIRLPWIGPLTPLPIRIGTDKSMGVFSLSEGHTLAVTRGIGMLGPRARLFAPPEIMLLRTETSGGE